MRTMRTTRDRFWDMVIVKGPDECWNWKRGKTNGYGMFKIDEEWVYAHRFAWELKNGKIPPDRVIMHTCDNPICCNPRHLKLGTQKDNVDDREDKKRGRRVGTGETEIVGRGNSKLLPYKVKDIVKKHRAGKSTKKLAKEYKTSERTIRRIVNGETWKDIKV